MLKAELQPEIAAQDLDQAKHDQSLEELQVSSSHTLLTICLHGTCMYSRCLHFKPICSSIQSVSYWSVVLGASVLSTLSVIERLDHYNAMLLLKNFVSNAAVKLFAGNSMLLCALMEACAALLASL